MGNYSFMQNSCLGGQWSVASQGRMDSQEYKRGLKLMLNYLPMTELGAMTRRPATRWIAPTRAGNPAKLIAFDFSFVQPYQIELSPGFARFFAGLNPVVTAEQPYVISVSAAKPAIVTLSIAPPWANNDYVFFQLNQLPLVAPLLANRQFQIQSVAGATFALFDALTGDAIDGSAIAYTAGTKLDYCFKVFELAAPYGAPDLNAIRGVQDNNTLLLLHTKYQPQVVTQTNGVFTLGVQSLTDGPYMDLNTTATTLTPSAKTGSITVTASALTGINGGQGFLATDVNRLIRIQSGPSAWSNVTTYAKNTGVTGTDGNIYTSAAGGNIGHDPTTDDGTNWTLATITVTWSWLKITAVTDTTHVTATVMGAALTSTLATTVWRLGVFSDTTGWPTCGGYHEGRLWLSGVIGNRIDGSNSNDHFNFTPTAIDGTVADNHAVAATSNSNEVNQFFWLISGDQGLLGGTQGCEFLVRASELGDPITPSTVQLKVVSRYGSAAIEPVFASRTTVFVQRQQRRIMDIANYPYGETAGWFADNIAKYADDLVAPGIAEIRWQQETNEVVWARRNDGKLIGCTFRHGPYGKESFAAWHQHTLGHGRTVESLSTGPSWDGKSTSLYLVTNQTTDSTKPDYFVRRVEVLMPVFDESVPDYGAMHADGAPPIAGAKVLQTANGDTINGVRFYGLWPLNGYTVQPFIGGLDLGDFLVANGQIDVPFTATFTKAYYTGLSTILYGVYGANGSYKDATPLQVPQYGANNLMGLVGVDGPAVFSSSGGAFLLNDTVATKVYQVQFGANPPGIRRIDAATTGTEELQAGECDIFGNNPATLGAWSSLTTYASGDILTASDGKTYKSKINGNLNNDPTLHDTTKWWQTGAKALGPSACCFHPAGYIIDVISTGNQCPITKISASTLKEVASFGVPGNGFGGSNNTILQCPFFLIPLRVKNGANYVVSAGISSAGHSAKEISLLNIDNMGNHDQFNFPVFKGSMLVDEVTSTIVPGADGTGTWFAIGKGNYVGAETTAIGVYKMFAPSGTLQFVKTGTVTPAQVDATWSHFSNVLGASYDYADGNLLVLFETTDAVANLHYLAKINANTAAVMWKIALADSIASVGTDLTMPCSPADGVFAYWRNADKKVYIVNTIAGTQSTQQFNNGFAEAGVQYWDYVSSSITIFGSYAQGSGPVPTYLGAYLAAHANTLSSQWGRIYLGVNYSLFSIATLYSFYGSIGCTYTSQSQLLRPDFGQDAGTQGGPAFAKKRRLHWASLALRRCGAAALKWGTDFLKLNVVKTATPGGTAYAAPNLFTGTVTDTVSDDYSFEGCLATQVTRPYPATISAFGGYLESMDK